MCVFSREQKKCEERDKRERKKQKRKSRRKTTDREREAKLPEKKRSKKRDKNSLFFSLPIGGGVWRYSVVIIIPNKGVSFAVILLTLSRKKRKKEAQGRESFSYRIRETKRENSKRFPRDSILAYSNWLHQRTRAKKTFHVQ